MAEAKRRNILHVALLREMADKDALRQQVVESTKLLLKAVDRLESTCKGEGRSGNQASSSSSRVYKKQQDLQNTHLCKNEPPIFSKLTFFGDNHLPY